MKPAKAAEVLRSTPGQQNTVELEKGHGVRVERRAGGGRTQDVEQVYGKTGQDLQGEANDAAFGGQFGGGELFARQQGDFP